MAGQLNTVADTDAFVEQQRRLNADAEAQPGSNQTADNGAMQLRRGQYVGATLAAHHKPKKQSQQQQPQQRNPSRPVVAAPTEQRGFYALRADDIDGAAVDFAQFAGKVVLVVNVASECGFTEANYRGLAALHRKYGAHGLEILAFPCNQFGGQEPGGPAEIKAVAQGTYGAAFRLMAKVEVNGPGASPVFQWLKRNLPVEQGGGGGVGPGKDLVWNFQKFIVDKQGRPVALHYQQYDAPRVEADVYRLLQQ